MCHSRWNIQEMAVWRIFSTLVGCRNKSLQSRNIVWMGKVDDINRNIVLLQSHAHVLKVFLIALQRMTDENDDPLPLSFVHSMLE